MRSKSPRPSHPAPQHVATRLPVVEERLEVGTRVQEIGAVRIRIESDLREQPVLLERTEEYVDVERVRVDRPVDAPREPWSEGDTLVVPVYAEVAVVERRLVLVEELRLRRRTERRSHTEVHALRQERAVVERRRMDGSWEAIDAPASAFLAGRREAFSSSTPSGTGDSGDGNEADGRGRL